MSDPNQINEPVRRWMSFQELAEHLGISVYSVYRAHKAGRFVTCEVVDGLVRIDAWALPEGLHSRRAPGHPPRR